MSSSMLRPPLGLLVLVRTLLSFILDLQLLKLVVLRHHLLQFESFLEWLFLALQPRIQLAVPTALFGLKKS